MDRILFLDIDGVLNPFAARSGLHSDWRKVPLFEHEPQRGRYWVSAQVGRWLQQLLECQVQIVWATTWVNHPDDLERYGELLGLPAQLDRIRFDPTSDEQSGESGKRAGVAAWIASNCANRHGRRVVWIDDQIGPGDRRFATSNGIIVVRPSPASGVAHHGLRNKIVADLSIEVRND